MINRLIKFFVNLKWKKDKFYTWSWGVDENVTIHITSEESYQDRHRFGLMEETFDVEESER